MVALENTQLNLKESVLNSNCFGCFKVLFFSKQSYFLGTNIENNRKELLTFKILKAIFSFQYLYPMDIFCFVLKGLSLKSNAFFHIIQLNKRQNHEMKFAIVPVFHSTLFLTSHHPIMTQKNWVSATPLSFSRYMQDRTGQRTGLFGWHSSNLMMGERHFFIL